MVLIVLALLFLGMLGTFVALAAKTTHKAPRAVVSSFERRSCPICGHGSTCKHDGTLFRALPLDVVADGSQAGFPKGTWVL